jgi:PAS domain S-box-containing protein
MPGLSKAATRSHRDRDTLLRALAASMDAVIVADDRDEIVFFNDAAARLFGHASEAVMGRPLAETIITPRYRAAHAAGMAIYRETRRAGAFVGPTFSEGLHSSGAVIALELSIGIVEPLTGPLFVYFARRAEEDAANRAVAPSGSAGRSPDNAANEHFLAVMSHELRTPLTGILGALDLLRNTQLSIAQRGLADTASRSANALLSIISDIIEMSQAHDDALPIARTEFSLLTVVADVLAVVAHPASQKDNQIRVQYDPALQHEFVGDQAKIRQVLLHLMTNAVKFTANGNIDLSITRCGGTMSRPQIELSVSDTGQGVSEEDHHRLFREFSQVELGYGRHAEGNGLGLALSKRLVEAMAGEIGYETNPAKGSRFWFRLALDLAEARSDGLPSERDLRALRSGAELTLLVVDDNETIRSIVQALISQLGHKVHAAESGAAALELARSRRFDGIFMDISMPGIDGVEAIKLIRDLPSPASAVPIVALTGHALAADRDRFIAAGADHYLSKPVSLPALAHILDILQDHAIANPAAHSPKEETATVPIMDPAILDTLRDAVPAEDLIRVLEGFARDLQQRRHSLTASPMIEPEAVRQIVHSLAGSSSSLGARRLSDFAHAMEEAAILGDSAALIGDISRFVELIDQTVEAAKQAGADLRRASSRA